MQTEVKNTQKPEYLVQILECCKAGKKGYGSRVNNAKSDK